jgi:hypothetical protein
MIGSGLTLALLLTSIPVPPTLDYTHEVSTEVD